MNVGRAEVVDEDAMWAALQEDEGRRLAFGSDVWWTESGVVQKPKPEPKPEPEGEKQGEGAPEPTVTTRPANPNGCRNARRGLRKKAGLRKRAQALSGVVVRVVSRRRRGCRRCSPPSTRCTPSTTSSCPHTTAAYDLPVPAETNRARQT